jgi:ABC-type methionine transport system ATPase subunit
LNGAILGMTKKEITSKLDEIIAFSGCERYIDTPTKRYSSGMTVRLAFAVAAFLEPEILVVDEVLAVGDAEFQKKAIGKMQDISKSEGRTVLFVSHNMAAVRSLCTRGIVMEQGFIKFSGPVDKALGIYAENTISKNAITIFNEKTNREGSGKIKFTSIELKDNKGVAVNEFSIGEDINITFEIENIIKEKTSQFGIQIFDINDMPIFHIMPRDSNFLIEHNNQIEKYSVLIKDIRLFPGIYYISLTASSVTGHEIFDFIPSVISFEITDGGIYTVRSLPRVAGLFFLNPEWKKMQV